MSGVVIIGAGHAGGRTAQYLREFGYSDEIRIFGDENVLPYERPPVSKQLLNGKKNIDDCLLHKKEFYIEKNIEIYLNNKISLVDFDKKEIIDNKNKIYNYSKLVFANGASPIKLNLKKLEGIFYLRSYNDSFKIQNSVTSSKNICIIGAGFIGLEIAAILRQQYDDKKITIIDASNSILNRNSNKNIRKKISNIHQENNINFIFNSELTEIAGNDKIEKLILKNNTSILCDILIIGIGVRPNIEFLNNLKIENGIKVDEYCQTSIEDVYAVGDVCCFKNIKKNIYSREESWNNAEQQSKIVANNILGNKIAYDEIPWFWTDQYNENFQFLGEIDNFDNFINRQYEENKLIEFYIKKNKIVGAFAQNMGRDIKITKEIIKNNIEFDFKLLDNLSFNLKSLIRK